MEDQPSDDIDNLFIEAQQVKKSHDRKVATPTGQAKKIRVRGSVEVARDNYRAAKRMHKTQIKQLKRAIKAHRLQIRQAKNSYKLIKINEKR